MTGWEVAHIGFAGDDFELNGLHIWTQKWRQTNFPSVTLPHPAYPNQMHAYEIWEIGASEQPVRFAAAELSNGVWGIYVPDQAG